MAATSILRISIMASKARLAMSDMQRLLHFTTKRQVTA